jgi:hypothetical protein
VLLCDKHERLVPEIMVDWYITDINKDIKLSELFHFTAIKIQVRHIDHLFRIYIKSMGKDTVCRVEETKHPEKKSAIEFINDVFNPAERFDMIDKIGCKCKALLASLESLCEQCRCPVSLGLRYSARRE